MNDEERNLAEAGEPADEAIRLHPFYGGKMQTLPKCAIRSFADFSVWYTPGVAAPCKAIEREPDLVFEHTNRGNLVAVVSDGSRVLGLGDIGPEAGLPVMEGKALLFKYLGGVDAVALCLRSASEDDFVRAVEMLEPSFGAINLEDIATLKVDFRLPELYLDRVRPGQTVEIASDVLAGERFAATVEAIDPLVDAQGRALRLRASLPNPELRLRPGVFVRVRLILAERADVVMVPEAALVPAPGNTQFVYRVAEGKAQRVEVRTGTRRDAMVEVVEGVQAGEVVVTAGQLKLRDGAAVKLATGGVARAD